ncbi:MAG TPA: hypothetical protein H9733_07075 [Candidatus Anaerotignum merdipullorum]|nr:hypothetical protein [Candidatus Anaerotignum merdipullorum]
MRGIFRKKVDEVTLWLEGQKEEYLARAAALEHRFYAAFYEQCIESTVADGYEMFLLDFSTYNYFRAHRADLDGPAGQRFLKLAGIHHTIRVVRRRKKELSWDEMKRAMWMVYALNEEEQKMAEILYQCACVYQSRFSDLFARTTARYLFGTREMTPQVLAFLLNFWYNSYSSFMASFVGYVPFHVRLKKATAG